MKKTGKILTTLTAICVFMSASIFGETLYKGKVSRNSFVLQDNHTYGNNFSTQGQTKNIFPKEYTAKKGDKVMVHIEGTFDKEVVFNDNGPALQFVLVDGSPKANYWLELTDRIKIEKSIQPGEKLVWDYTFIINKDAVSAAGNDGCGFTMETSADQTEAVTLKTTLFNYIIER